MSLSQYSFSSPASVCHGHHLIAIIMPYNLPATGWYEPAFRTKGFSLIVRFGLCLKTDSRSACTETGTHCRERIQSGQAMSVWVQCFSCFWLVNKYVILKPALVITEIPRHFAMCFSIRILSLLVNVKFLPDLRYAQKYECQVDLFAQRSCN